MSDDLGSILYFVLFEEGKQCGQEGAVEKKHRNQDQRKN